MKKTSKPKSKRPAKRKGKKSDLHLQNLLSADHPDFADLLESFHFDPEKAEILLNGERMVLVDNKSLGIMRRELILALGYERARAVLSRTGYEMGTADAELALKLRHGENFFEDFNVGPQLHALKGSVRVEAKVFEANPDSGEFYSEFYWHNSAECHAHLEQMGISHESGGWLQIAYASGYTSVFFGRPIIFRELECIAKGYDKCFLVGKPASEWEDSENELRRFRAESYPKITASEKTSNTKKRVNKNRLIVGASAGFNLTLHLIDKVASTESPVLFSGESGVGKEVFARELHQRSRRAEKPLLAINCAAIPESLIEAELFGVEKGAFTGAEKSRPGRFERAAGGTLFLDEIGTLSFSAQGKLLRVLQEGEFERVGGNKTLKTDVRLIAATNSNLDMEVEQGTFRRDLFYRLNTFPVHIPPLRERRADIPVLMNYFLRIISEKQEKNITGFSNSVTKLFQQYHWPGNVRELENIIERGIILAEAGEAIDIQHLIMSSDRVLSKEDIQNKDPFRAFVLTNSTETPAEEIGKQLLDSGLSKEEINNSLIRAALERSEGNVTQAASLTGLSRSQINYWIKSSRSKH